MKVQPKVYTFEHGDIVGARNYDQVAIRLSNGQWKHTNLDHDNSSTLHDAEVEACLEDGSWVYVHNRKLFR